MCCNETFYPSKSLLLQVLYILHYEASLIIMNKCHMVGTKGPPNSLVRIKN